PAIPPEGQRQTNDRFQARKTDASACPDQAPHSAWLPSGGTQAPHRAAEADQGPWSQDQPSPACVAATAEDQNWQRSEANPYNPKICPDGPKPGLSLKRL